MPPLITLSVSMCWVTFHSTRKTRCWLRSNECCVPAASQCTESNAPIRVRRQRMDEMSPEELRHFVEIDGHVGLEEEQEHAARFQKFFTYVAAEPRYTLCLSSEEFIKQADKYGLPFEDDFIDYLRGLSFKERRAFDMAMGYVFNKVSDLHISLPKGRALCSAKSFRRSARTLLQRTSRPAAASYSSAKFGSGVVS